MSLLKTEPLKTENSNLEVHVGISAGRVLVLVGSTGVGVSLDVAAARAIASDIGWAAEVVDLGIGATGVGWPIVPPGDHRPRQGA